jgi:hypothetical protein
LDTDNQLETADILTSPGEAMKTQKVRVRFERPPREKITREEALKRMKTVRKRTAKMIATIGERAR